MKRKFFYKISGIFMLSILMVPATVSAARVTETYKYDQNKYSSIRSNFHDYTYTTIPNDYFYKTTYRYYVSEGWNYVRYLAVLSYGR